MRRGFGDFFLCFVLPGVVAGCPTGGNLGRGEESNVVYDHAEYVFDFSYLFFFPLMFGRENHL